MLSEEQRDRLADAIRSLRRRNGFTMATMAEVAGVTQASISRYESGDMTPKPLILSRLLEYADDYEKAEIQAALGLLIEGREESPLGNLKPGEEEFLRLMLHFYRSGQPETIEVVKSLAASQIQLRRARKGR